MARRSSHSGCRASAASSVAAACAVQPSAASAMRRTLSASASQPLLPAAVAAAAAAEVCSTASSSRSRKRNRIEPRFSPAAGEEFVIVAGFVERLPKERLGGAEVVVVRPHAREVDQGPRSIRSRLELRYHLVQHHPRPRSVAVLEDRKRRVHRAAKHVATRVRRREPHGALVELRGRGRGTAGIRSRCRRLEGARHPLVGSGGGERQVPGPLLGVGHLDAGPGMEVTPHRGVDRGVGPRRQERMGEADAAVPHGDDLRPLGLVQRTAAVAGHGFHERRRVGWAIAAAAASARRASDDSASSRAPTSSSSATGSRSPGSSWTRARPGTPAPAPERRTDCRRRARAGAEGRGAAAGSRAAPESRCCTAPRLSGEQRERAPGALPSAPGPAQVEPGAPGSVRHAASSADRPRRRAAARRSAAPRAEAASSHCTSSIATTSGRSCGELPEHREHRERHALLVGRVIALVVQQERHLERASLARGQLRDRRRAGRAADRPARRTRSSSPPRRAGRRA